MSAKILPMHGRQKVRLYLAGPMRGRDRYNFDAFADAAADLRGLNYDVVSPAEHDLDDGFDPEQTVEAQGFDLKAAFAWDLEQVLAADAVVTLAGWQHSSGTRAEVAVAQAVSIPVLDLAEIVWGGSQVAA